MSTAPLSRERDDTTANSERDSTQKLVVTWQHPHTRDVSPVAILTQDPSGYRFEYLSRASAVPGFRSLLGFPDFERVYTSIELFPLFAQRAMDPRRPDYSRYVDDLGLGDDATPWEQIARSGGTKESDTLQLFPVPRFIDGQWRCHFLVSGMRYMMSKEVVVHGQPIPVCSEQDYEDRLAKLKTGDEVSLHHEEANASSDHALLVLTAGELPLGYAPDWLASEIFEFSNQDVLDFSISKINPIEAGWHMRLVVEMDAALPAGYRFFDGSNWTLASQR
ncbi:hypothetical protein SAMN06295909_3729 [Plantibacter sp. VKM Ac-1784]|uniref:HIRAN domain-containing protein n=1 Tax=Plantibacter elymi (nom. nud.) TaxID=199708 RepID=A0ABY1RIL5_9MICO|nr:hypothetical protein [Plantibacter sp. VKM Ac-1784]SMQ75235.1 hypothetical protein SAMN06295909_3729 [Plantibacter sp. VKM Ac-1784]